MSIFDWVITIVFMVFLVYGVGYIFISSIYEWYKNKRVSNAKV